MQTSDLRVKYHKFQKIGSGSYGDVFKAKNRNTNETLAIKRIKLDSHHEGIASTTIREIAALKELAYHPNVVSLKEVVLASQDKKLHLVFEFVDRDLKGYMVEHDRVIQPAVVKSFMYQMLNGLALCHMHRILHRDLKPQNILISGDNQLKLADFGLARAFNMPVAAFTHEVVTLWYRSPEILLGGAEYSTPVDVWSVGCIFAEMANGRPLFPGDSEIDQLFQIFKILGAPSEDTWGGVTQLPDYQAIFPKFKSEPWTNVVPSLDANGIDLLDQLLQYDPAKRISAKRALEHPYFDDLDKSKFMSYADMVC